LHLSVYLKQFMKFLQHVTILMVAKTKLQFSEPLPKLLDLVNNPSVVLHHVMDHHSQFMEILFLHAEPSHLGYTRAQSSGGGKPLFIGIGLEVADDVVGFQPTGDFRHLSTPGGFR